MVSTHPKTRHFEQAILLNHTGTRAVVRCSRKKVRSLNGAILGFYDEGIVYDAEGCILGELFGARLLNADEDLIARITTKGIFHPDRQFCYFRYRGDPECAAAAALVCLVRSETTTNQLLDAVIPPNF